MDPLFSHLTLVDVHRTVFRNVVSIGSSQDLFDDLTSSPAEWALAQQVEDQVKPPPYQSRTPVIHRPFEDAQWANAIGWPFKHWQASRFSDGSFGVWYGCESAETSVYETVYHWYSKFLTDAGFEREQVIGERKLYDVACDAALVNLRPLTAQQPGLMHKTDYSFAQAVGARLHREGHPGLVSASVRHATGHNYAILNPSVLSNPRLHCQLTYRLDGHHIVVEKQPGVVWMDVATAAL
ncbi:MAG TPA: RES family NAD+ phosphorylase [Rhodoferax sp.]